MPYEGKSLPAYFMKSTDQSHDALARVWRSSIIPLLEEHYYGRWHLHEVRFRFDTMWARATPPGEA